MTDTLVLNADATPLRWMPISTKTWMEAVKIYYEDRVVIVEEYEDWVIRSPSVAMKVPAVIMVRDYVRPDYRVRLTKYNIKVRDNFTCQYCGKWFDPADLTIDHVVPQYHGGRSVWSNCVAACGLCNRRKAHFLDMLPLAKPVRPTFGLMLERRRQQPVTVSHPSWLPYLGWPEHLVTQRGRARPETVKLAA